MINQNQDQGQKEKDQEQKVPKEIKKKNPYLNQVQQSLKVIQIHLQNWKYPCK